MLKFSRKTDEELVGDVDCLHHLVRAYQGKDFFEISLLGLNILSLDVIEII